MNVALRRSLSALAFAAVLGLLLGGAASTALALRERAASVEALQADLDTLQARLKRAGRQPERASRASPFIEARSVTLAGAALQQRLESAIAKQGGQLVSSKVDVGPRGDERRVTLAAELTIAQPAMQALLFDLETGRPYIFVDALEARAPEPTERTQEGMRVSLTVAGQWGGPK